MIPHISQGHLCCDLAYPGKDYCFHIFYIYFYIFCISICLTLVQILKLDPTGNSLPTQYFSFNNVFLYFLYSSGNRVYNLSAAILFNHACNK